MIKVLGISREFPPYDKGGEGRVLEYLAKYSKKFEVDLTVVTGYPFLKSYKESYNGIQVYRVPMIGNNFLTKIPTFAYFLWQILKNIQDKFDLIYSISVPIFGKLKKPLIAHFQNTRYGEYIACRMIKKKIYAFLNKIYIPFNKILLKKADGVFVLSRNMIEEIKAIKDCEGKEVVVIPNGVDTELFKPSGERRFTSQEKKVLYVGRLDVRKGISTLFYALKEVTKRVKVKLLIAGEGREKIRLTALAKALSLPVEFLGKITYHDLPQIYERADLFVLPSLYEPFGMVALEAMACGTPTVVSTACPIEGVPKFKKGSAKDLADLLLSILSSEEKLVKISHQCREIAKRYDWENIISKIVTFFRKFV
ncbi:MAG: hypothetical protein DRP72_01900 [Candidatus Omnitrophota bacterium]|nr:MAG: hypothetical protein DRP72_01900 [Candidatus Omnitrophota bacterium]